MRALPFKFAYRCIKSTGSVAIVCVLGLSVGAQDAGSSPRMTSQEQTLSDGQQQPVGSSGAKESSTRRTYSPSLQAIDVQVPLDRQIISGRLVCAKPWEASQICGHSKNDPVWGCKLYCAKGPDGSQYALQTTDRAYAVNGGDPKQLKHFAAYDVMVTGELSGGVVEGNSILKRAKRSKHAMGAVLGTATR